MISFIKKVLIIIVVVCLPLSVVSQVSKFSPKLKKGTGYYIDNDGNKIEGKIKVWCAMAHGVGEVSMPRIEIKVGKSKYKKIYFDQIQKVVIGLDTFIRIPGRVVILNNSFGKDLEKELEFDMLHIEISGKMKYCKGYWYSISGRFDKEVIIDRNRNKHEINCYYKNLDECKEKILNLIKDNPKVYDKWKDKSVRVLYKNLDDIVVDYNTM